MHEIDPTKIPAFQRKRSLLAKQRKNPGTAAKKPRVRKPKTERRDFEEMKTCGQCEGYFDKINVAIIKLTSPLRIGDIVIFEKEGGLFQQTVTSMQIDRREVRQALSGSDIGLKVLQTPTVGTRVYKII